MGFEVFDNVLNKEDFELLQYNMITTDILPWFLANVVADLNEVGHHYYFTHMFYNNYKVQSPFMDKLLTPLIHKIDPKALIRIKGNLYPSTQTVEEHRNHSDYAYDHKGALFFVNSNNGYTTMYDGTRIESKENRLLLFDPSKPHRSSTCSDTKYRVTINFNYF